MNTKKNYKIQLKEEMEKQLNKILINGYQGLHENNLEYEEADPKKKLLDPKHAQVENMCKSTCKKFLQNQWKPTGT